MPEPKRSLTFDFAKDFDREDEEKKRIAREQQKKADADLRRSAEKFAADLRSIAEKAGYEVRLKRWAENEESKNRFTRGA